MGMEQPYTPEPAGTLTQAVKFRNKYSFVISNQNLEYMSAAVKKKADLPFYLLGNIGKFVKLFGSESRRWGINPEIESGKGFQLTGFKAGQIA